MISKAPIVVGLGEVLWDFLPNGKQLGGAPANFAYGARMLGDEGIVASRIGNDDLGTEARSKLAGLGFSNEHLQRDPSHLTGTVNVLIDEVGHPPRSNLEEILGDIG